MIPAIYAQLCPQCGKDLQWGEIEKGVCSTTGKKLYYSTISWQSRKFEEFFRERTGFEMRAVQKMWARRILSGDSFAAIAPTGVGKTIFGIMMALYLANSGKKSYIIVPTTILLKDVVMKAQKYADKERLAYYFGKMKKSEKEENLQKIVQNEFDILITTTAFLSKNYYLISKKKFQFVFVDDVDSILKRSKNVEKVVHLVLNGNGTLMVSTATGTRGYNTKILREKLNFDVGSTSISIRNIVDIKGPKDAIREIVKKMGGGAIIYTPTIEDAEKVTKLLGDFKAGLVTSHNKKAFDQFRDGELDFLIGVATPYGSLVRGIDMPERIRYTLFYKIPRFRVGVEDVDKLSDRFLVTLAYLLRDANPHLPALAEKGEYSKIREIIRDVFSSGRIKETDEFVYEDGYIIFPDIKTYLQGSGRASRLYCGGITKGASFLLDDNKFISIFEKRADIYDLQFVPLESVDLTKLKEEIDLDRKRLRERGKGVDIIRPALFIVESPNKARHISRFFGKPNVRVIENAIVYEVAIGKKILIVAPSLGHVVDLVTRRGYHGVETGKIFVPIYSAIRKCRECGYQFTEGDKCPVCGSDNIYSSASQINILRKLAFETGEVIIGTDPDTEGEKIAWDLKNLLSGYASSIKRAEFHEVTKKAIIKAIEEHREINENLVKAQMVRRIEDRWIGFELSQILWRVFKDKNLSAGRAQTPVLGWIIERYREHLQKREAWFIKGLDAEVPWKTPQVRVIVKKLNEEEKEIAYPPYTTDEILNDANRLLKFGAEKTMKFLQELFECGLITYHRTDSTHVSDAGLKIAKNYLGEKNFVPRRWGKQGAHECIRPTRPCDRDTLVRYITEGAITYELAEEHIKLYDLIFRRFMASQSRTYLNRVIYLIKGEDGKSVEIEIITSARGYGYKLYPYRIKIHRPLKEGTITLNLTKKMVSPPLYTQADVVRLMKERRIGRPSTYATIIGKLYKRKYIVDRKLKIVPTERGMKIHSFLSKRYGDFVSEERTRFLENVMDLVEKGERDYQATLRDLYAEMQKIRGK